MPMKSASLRTALLVTTLLSLAACDKQPEIGAALDSMQGMKEESYQHLTVAAADADATENLPEALRLTRELYKQDPDDKAVALKYARLLRKGGRTNLAIKVLAPLTVDKAGRPLSKAQPEMMTELAAAYIAAADFNRGEQVLDAVLENKDAAAQHTEAYNLMGVVLDAKGEHKEAEVMFNMALDRWKGNPASVMNNLALSLANQGMFDQSLSTLRKALVISPDKQEVARNIQIVQDLRDNIVPGAPVKLRKVIVPKAKSQPACEPCPVPAPG